MESDLGFYHHWDSTQKLANEFIFWISKQIQHLYTHEKVKGIKYSYASLDNDPHVRAVIGKANSSGIIPYLI